jgi:hypothetical protein
MKQIKKWQRFLLVCIFLIAAVSVASASGYDYPISDPYEAAILGTPIKDMPSLPDKIRVKDLEMTVFPDRKIPEVFWYGDKLRYSLAWQKEKAPLIFMIAGTGAGYDSEKMLTMQKAFFQAGFHVISLASPTHPNFITAASSSMLPGDIQGDCKDLYRVMQHAWAAAEKTIEVTDFFLTGYSLGGAQSAFISRLDDQEKKFNFKKVLMINPPVSLYDSAVKLDKMLENNIPGGMDNFAAFYDQLMKNVASSYKYGDAVDLNYGFFYNAFNDVLPSQGEEKAVIGLSFRISAASLFFVSDVMTNAGFVVPPNINLTKTTSLTDYFKITARAGGFGFYVENILFPAYQKKNPNLTLDQIIYESSLLSIEEYLRNTEKISLVTNEDDFILAQGDVDYFRRVFQSRAKIYPKGGHCGNMGYKDNIAYRIDFFKSENKGN